MKVDTKKRTGKRVAKKTPSKTPSPSSWFYPYKAASKSVRGLKKILGAREIKREGSSFKPSRLKTVINWGSSEVPANYLRGGRVLNKPDVVGLCSNKRDFFNKYAGEEYLVPATTRLTEALEWVKEGKTVVCRTKLTGHSGEGIIIYTPEKLLADEKMPEAPLYTMYKKKKHEFRLHIVNGEVIDSQRKVLRTDDDRPETPDFHIRTHNNGFIFARNDKSLDDEEMMKIVEDATLACFNDSGLDFGAIDVIYNSKEKKAYILEINTAPGLTGTTLENYAEAFKKMGL